MILKTKSLVFALLLVVLVSTEAWSQYTILDESSDYPVSYATVSFGNGNGIFADDLGEFYFSKKLYPDIDTLYISALGYKSIRIPTENLPKTLYLNAKVDQLEEVVLKVNSKRRFTEDRLKPYLDDDYYKCWLPTIESEIAVFFTKTSQQDQQIKEIHFPIALESKDWKKRNRRNSDKKKFSTLFKVNIYNSKDGKPNEPLTYETIVFRATEKNGDVFSLNIEDKGIYMPQNGLFVSIQVMGYTDKSGKLLPNKKYKEIKTPSGIVKIPTNFRPLLPFTDQIKANNTFIKRVFINGNNWVNFDKGQGIKSTLIDQGLYNYGIGLTLKTYEAQ